MLKKRFGDDAAGFFAEIEKVEQVERLNGVLLAMIESEPSLDALRALIR